MWRACATSNSSLVGTRRPQRALCAQTQHQIDEEVFAELWRIRSCRRGEERSIEGTTAAIAAVLRTQLAAQLCEGPEQRAVVNTAVANTSATVQSLLSNFRHVFLPREKCTDVATHVRFAPRDRSSCVSEVPMSGRVGRQCVRLPGTAVMWRRQGRAEAHACAGRLQAREASFRW